jgi:hypothetical protein
MKHDAERERQRLAKYYGSLSEEELQRIAASAGDFTDAARDILAAELDRRGLELLSSTPVSAPFSFRELKTIRQFRDLPEALLAKGILDSAGIECFLADDNMVRMDWFISNLLGGIKLMVRPEDVEESELVLQQPIPEGFDVEGVGEYQQPRCPMCQAVDITFQGLNKPIAYTSAWLGVPLPVEKNVWKCNVCGHFWEESGQTETQPASE